MKASENSIFIKNQVSLKSTSKDESGIFPEYMTQCEKSVVDFDKVKREFMNALGESEECAHSVDAVAIEKERVYLIEFKNGDARREKQGIHLKARDSVLILNSIMNYQIEDARQSNIFVLVYNEEKVALGEKEKLAMAKAKKAMDSFALFDLGKMRGFCFREVYTFNRKEFEDQIVKKLGWE